MLRNAIRLLPISKSMVLGEAERISGCELG